MQPKEIRDLEKQCHFFVNFESSRLDFSDFWELFGALGSLVNDLRESLKHSGIQAEKLTFQGDPATGQVGGKLLHPGAYYQITDNHFTSILPDF